MAPEHSRQINRRSVSPGTGYGMTETNGLGTAVGGPELLDRPTSCGRPLLTSRWLIARVGKWPAAKPANSGSAAR